MNSSFSRLLLLRFVYCLWFGILPLQAAATPVFINELHYDNLGGDVEEGVEIAGPAGTSLTDWSLQFYNGSSGTVYRTFELAGVIPDLDAGFGVLGFTGFSLQNGSPDGLALANAVGGLVQFLSYEGSFVGVGGVAGGVSSIDIGVAEASDTPLGTSLQLFGLGAESDDFQWRSTTSSFGEVNLEQHFVGGQASVPLPGTLLLSLLGLGILVGRAKLNRT